MNNKALHYCITFTNTRSIGGYNELPTSFDIEFSFPVNSYWGNKLTIDEPYFEAYNGHGYLFDTEAAAEILDSWVNEGCPISAVYNPTPDKERPRLTITNLDTEEQVHVH